MLSTLSLGLLALVSAKPQFKQRLVAHETTVPTLYSEPTICYGDDECRGKEVCDMATYTCRPETTTPPVWTTPTPSAPNGCCHGDSYKTNDKCAIAMTEGKCAEKGCSWLITEDASDCVISTTESPTTTIEAGCCKGTSYLSNAECILGMDEKSCGRKCEWISGGVLQEDCVVTTSSSPTTTIEVGCCKGSDPKSDTMCNPKTDSNSCDRSNSCAWIKDGIIEDGDCTSETFDEPGCCYGDTVKTNPMCLEKEVQGDCERSGKCEWREDPSPTEPAVCDLPTTTSTSTPNPGCCYGNPAAAYSARWMDTCKTFGTEKECTLLLHDDGTPRCVFEPLGEYEDCETLWPTTTSTPSGCCHGDSYKANDKCAMLEDQVGCERKSCTWLLTADPKDCVITTTLSVADPGCCKGSSYKAQAKCFGLADRDMCERKSCEWVITENEDDCIITTTSTSPTTTVELGCCQGYRLPDDSHKANTKCNMAMTEDKCADKGCLWLVTEDASDCEPTTTSTPWLGAQYKQSQQQSRKKKNHRQEEAMLFGGGGDSPNSNVVGQAMQYQMSLWSVVLMLIAAFAVFQAYKWVSARKNKDYEYTRISPISSLLSAAMLISVANGAGFDWPQGPFPIDPNFMQNMVTFVWIPFSTEYETPIQARATSAIVETFWQCLAMYHPTALDVLTKERPAVVADDETIANYGNSETRMLCGAYASLMVANSLFPEATEANAEMIDTLGLDSSFLTMNSDVADCDIDDTVCLNDVAVTNEFYPEIMASIVAKQMLHFLANDGWNADGSIGVDGEECTANCMPYGDTTGYEPKRRAHRRWKPLSEDNGKGFSYYYSHFTPHIGKTAVTKTISRAELESNRAAHPKYDYDTEIELVIGRLADLATNDTAKMLVEFFDDKAQVMASILSALETLLEWSWEERQVFLTGYYAGEYDAVIQSWHEKVQWDRVRPTTLIKENGDQRITTFGGPFRGLREIKSRDFEAYKRVMPHSEYPSGSSCICHTAAQFSRTFLAERHGITEALSVQIPNNRGPFAAGSSKLEPGLTPSEDLFITMESLSQLSEICGESRLWGGMHFTASVPAGVAICDGLGIAGYQYVNELIDGQPL